jgi:hypothetical protein
MTATRKESKISRTYITATAVVFSLLIITAALSFNWYIAQNAGLLKSIIMEINNDMLLGKIELVMDRLEQDRTEDAADIKKMIADFCTEEKGFLYAVIYARTSDDNYFKVIETVPISKNMTLNLEKKSLVMEDKEINYLKKALHHALVDPALYSQDGLCWQNVYTPFIMGKKIMVLEFMLSAHRARDAIASFNQTGNQARFIFAAASAVLALAVIVLSLVSSHNFTLLITGLTEYMNKAASGDLDVNLKTTDDESLNQLAQSFNSLIDELRDRNDRPGTDPYADIFRQGVTSLKENRLTEAVAVFTTLSMVRPEGFGSFFHLGVAHAKLKNYAVSLEMFARSKALNPGHELTDRYIDKVKKIIAADAS